MISRIDVKFLLTAHRECRRHHVRTLQNEGHSRGKMIVKIARNHMRHWGHLPKMINVLRTWMRLSPQVKKWMIDYLPQTHGDLQMALYHYNLEQYIASAKARRSMRPILVDYGYGIVEMV